MNRISRGAVSRALLATAAAAAWLLPGAVLSAKRYTDPFYYFRAFRAELSVRAGELSTANISTSYFDPIRAGYEASLVALMQFTGLDAGALASVPLGSLVVPMMFGALVWSLSRDIVLAFLMSAYLAYNHALLGTHFNTFVYFFAHVLLFAFVLCVYRWHKTRRAIWAIPASMLLISSFFTYHTTTLWAIVILGTSSLFAAGLRREWKRSKRYWAAAGACVAATIAYLAFDRVILNAISRRLATEGWSVTDAVLNAVHVLRNVVGGASSAAGSYEIVYVSDPVAARLLLLAMGLLSGAMLIVTVVLIYRLMRRSDLRNKYIRVPEFALFVGLVCAAAFHTVAYALYGQFSSRAVHLLLPVAFLACWKVLAAQGWKVPRAWAGALAVVCATAFMFFQDGVPRALPTRHYDTVAGLLPGSTTVVTDLLTYGNLVVEGAPPYPELADLSATRYAQVISGGLPPDAIAVLDMREDVQNLQALDWRYFEPFAWHRASIRSATSRSVVYDSGSILVVLPP